MEKAVEADNLRKSFELKKREGFKQTVSHTMAVDGLSLSVNKGESVAFIGPNGAGKSTTIKMLTGILYPDSGSASVLGLTPWSQRNKLAYKMGAVFGQRSQLWYHLPPQDSFDLLAKIYSMPDKAYKQRRNMLVERFNLEPFLSTQVRKLSLGQRMRAEIAASLLHAPDILFLDEPTIGLDVIARQELRSLIRQWNKENGLTIFLTSHDAGDIESVADRVIIINHGNIVLDSSVESMRTNYLNSKVIDARFHEQPKAIELNGVSLIDANTYELKLEIDCQLISIEEVMSAVLKAGPLADVTIEDPPLEEVIAHIYARAK